MVNIVGLSAFYHDAACCLLQEGNLVAAASEERFSRIKNDPRLPVNAFRFCLAEAGLTITDIDCLAYYESPKLKLERQQWAASKGAGQPPGNAETAFQQIRDNLGYEGPIRFYPHHQAHGASAFFYSGFNDAAVLTVDGVGEWATTTYGRGHGHDLDLFEEIHFPHSLGLFYATLTAYLGFRVNSGEYKVMGLAPYGRPLYCDLLRQLIQTGEGGSFQLNMDYFDFVSGTKMYSKALPELLGQPARLAGTGIETFHMDVARSLQDVLEEILLQKVTWLATQTDTPNLCMAGGVALNCVANARIRRDGPFENLFVQPAAGDAGSALGAAALAHIELTGKRHTSTALDHVYLGPAWSGDEIHNLLKSSSIPSLDFRSDEAGLLAFVAERLQQKQTVGWFQGSMEFGPRALGARSILANPLDPQIRDRLNRVVKKRESFRPFAPSVLLAHAKSHFALQGPSAFMLETCQVQSELDLPGITHVNGSARPQTVTREQNPRFAALLETFYSLSGCPMLVNTSFNVREEPIVCSPVDALLCMINSELDLLVLEDAVIERCNLPGHLEALLAAWLPDYRSRAISEHLYTFV